MTVSSVGENTSHNRVAWKLFVQVPFKTAPFPLNHPFGKGVQVIGDGQELVVAEAVDQNEALLLGRQALQDDVVGLELPDDDAFPEHVVPEIAEKPRELFSRRGELFVGQIMIERAGDRSIEVTRKAENHSAAHAGFHAAVGFGQHLPGNAAPPVVPVVFQLLLFDVKIARVSDLDALAGIFGVKVAEPGGTFAKQWRV